MWPPEYPPVPRALTGKRLYFQHQRHKQAQEVGCERGWSAGVGARGWQSRAGGAGEESGATETQP